MTEYTITVSAPPAPSVLSLSEIVVGPPGPVGPAGPPGLDSVESFVDLGDRTGAVTLNYAQARWQRMRLTGNVTLTLTNLPAGAIVGTLLLLVVQDATGARTITWPAGTKWPVNQVPTLSPGAAKTDLIQLTFVNGVIYGTVSAWSYT